MRVSPLYPTFSSPTDPDNAVFAPGTFKKLFHSVLPVRTRSKNMSKRSKALLLGMPFLSEECGLCRDGPGLPGLLVAAGALESRRLPPEGFVGDEATDGGG